MNPWLIFAFVTPVLWGFSNVMDAMIRRRFIKNDMAITWFLGITRVPFIIAFLFIAHFNVPPVPNLMPMLASGVLWMLPFVLYYRAIEFEETSRVVLLLQLIPVFVLLISFFTIGERLAAAQWLAFCFLFIGGILSALKRISGALRLSKAFWLMLLTGFLWAASDVLFKKSEPPFMSFLSAFAIYFLGSSLCSLVMLLFPRGRALIAEHFFHLPLRGLGMLLLNQAVGITGTFTFAYALTKGSAALTTVFIGIQPIFVVLWSLVLVRVFREVEVEDLSKNALLLKGAACILTIVGLSFLYFYA